MLFAIAGALVHGALTLASLHIAIQSALAVALLIHISLYSFVGQCGIWICVLRYMKIWTVTGQILYQSNG